MALNCTVASLVPFPIMEEKPGLFPPRYPIRASDMKTPEILIVGQACHYVYLDQDRKSLRVPDPADEVARSIVEDYITSQLGVDDSSRPALFWFPLEISPQKILAEYKDLVAESLVKQKNWMLNVVRMADNDWNRYHQHNVVSEFQRQCANHIGWKAEDHEWMNQPVLETFSCPVCRTPVQKGAVICPNCKVILDEEAAKASGLKFVSV